MRKVSKLTINTGVGPLKVVTIKQFVDALHFHSVPINLNEVAVLRPVNIDLVQKLPVETTDYERSNTEYFPLCKIKQRRLGVYCCSKIKQILNSESRAFEIFYKNILPALYSEVGRQVEEFYDAPKYAVRIAPRSYALLSKDYFRVYWSEECVNLTDSIRAEIVPLKDFKKINIMKIAKRGLRATGSC